ncbi:MAG: hypothetical protein ACUVRO_05925 [Armatimonadota bacterium]
MATAYTPGLRVSPFTIIRKTRRLPLKGQVLVSKGDHVQPDTVVARTELPGVMQTVKVAAHLGVEPGEVQKYLTIGIGDRVEKDQIIAESRALFGLIRTTVKSPVSGTVEHLSPVSGSLGIRAAPIPVEIDAYIQGTIAEVLPEEGVEVEAQGAFIQGIFGVGGERRGTVRVVVPSPEEPLDSSAVSEDHRGCVLVGGSLITADALKRAESVGASAIVASAIVDRDLIDFLGYDIGVAITGHEDIPLTIIVTEGFGRIPMARRTFDLLRSLEGHTASVNGATQIRAGVIRPEIIVPLDAPLSLPDTTTPKEQDLHVGATVRLIRQPYFGQIATVTDLPPEPTLIPSGATVRVLKAKLSTGEEVTVPRANVEILSE